jgi:ATP-binding cassette subfamily C protein LapB
MILRTLIQRLASRPLIAVEVLAVTLAAAVLAFAQPLFVIQVLNRYVAFGVDATLWTLAVGALAAVAFEFLFRRARLSMIRAVNAPHDRRLSERAFDLLATMETQAMGALSTSERRHVVGAVDTVAQAARPATVAMLLDLPFALILVAAVSFLNPVLGLIAATGFAAGLALAAWTGFSTRRAQAGTIETGLLRGGLINALVLSPDAVRAFNGGPRLARAWAGFDSAFRRLQNRLAMAQGGTQVDGQTLVAVVGIVIVAVGAVEVVAQRLDVGAMIGANILAARALQPVLRLGGSVGDLVRATQAFDVLARAQRMARERRGGGTLPEFKGRISFDDVAFQWPGAPAPLFEGVSLDAEPGSVLVVCGSNGAGKTTFARLLAGLLTPTRGSIRVDGAELRQIDLDWWRRQLVYLPQEPVFLPGSVREAITALKPDIDDAAVERLVETAGLRTFVASLPDGLDTPLRDGGTHLALGVRRRLALARALASDGRLAVLDEPLEALDADGRATLADVMRALAAFGRTIVVLSHDPSIIKGTYRLLDLDAKPEPRVSDHGAAAEGDAASLRSGGGLS